jgi:hypothetical protein
MSDDHNQEPVLGERGEHPLSVLLFSWMRGKMFARVFAALLGVVGVASIGLEIWLSYKPVTDITSMPGFYALFGFLAFAGAVLSGWPLGKLLRRREDYYETRSGEAGRDR